jgi:hypothetical protein
MFLTLPSLTLPSARILSLFALLLVADAITVCGRAPPPGLFPRPGRAPGCPDHPFDEIGPRFNVPDAFRLAQAERLPIGARSASLTAPGGSVLPSRR